MALVYLDQNPYDYLMAADVSAEILSRALQARSYALIVSENNFQEWASCWKSGSPEREAVGRRLLQFMLGIQPRQLLAPAHQLMMREIKQLFGHELRGPFLPAEDRERAEALFRRFANGVASDGDRKQMLDHWAVKMEASERAKQLAEQWRGEPDTSPSLSAFLARTPTPGIRRSVSTSRRRFFSRRQAKR